MTSSYSQLAHQSTVLPLLSNASVLYIPQYLYKMTSATFDMKIVPHEILKIIKLIFKTRPAKNKLPMNRIISYLLIHDQPLFDFYISTSANSSQENTPTALLQIKQMAYQHFRQQLNYINSISLN